MVNNFFGKIKDENDGGNEVSRYKILIVEDSSAVQTITRQVLSFYNYDVFFANNGRECIKMLEEGDYDMILMDLAMPIMNGVEALKEIRNLGDKRKANVPVIAFTGNADFYTRVELSNMSFNDYIEKPSDYVGIDELLNKHIDEYNRLYPKEKYS